MVTSLLYSSWAFVFGALSHAAMCNNQDAALMILLDPRVDASEIGNQPLRWAAGRGCTQLVKALLADPRVDPQASDNEPFVEACTEGHVEIVRLLLADGRADPRAQDSIALRRAAGHGYPGIVQMLLADERVAPDVGDESPLQWAVERQCESTIRLLVDCPTVVQRELRDARVETLLGNVSAARLSEHAWTRRRAVVLHRAAEEFASQTSVSEKRLSESAH